MTLTWLNPLYSWSLLGMISRSSWWNFGPRGKSIIFSASFNLLVTKLALNLNLVADHRIPIHLDVAARERLSLFTLQLRFLLLNRNIPVTLIQWLVPRGGCETVLGCYTDITFAMLRDTSIWQWYQKTSTLSMKSSTQQLHPMFQVLSPLTSVAESRLCMLKNSMIDVLNWKDEPLLAARILSPADPFSCWIWSCPTTTKHVINQDECGNANSNSYPEPIWPLGDMLGNTILFFHKKYRFFNQGGCTFCRAVPICLYQI